MARGRKKQDNLTLQEQLENVAKEIVKAEEHLKSLKEKRTQLNKKIEDEKKEKLYRAVVDSGRDIDEILATLCGNEEKV